MALLSIPFSVGIGRRIGQHREEHGVPEAAAGPPGGQT